MKKIPLSLLILMISMKGFSQLNNQFGSTIIDGAINLKELTDTTTFKPIKSTEFVVIRESATDYYIAVRSNSFTATNLLVKTDDHVRIMHASYSLGESFYTREGKRWKALIPYHWGFRDMMFEDSVSIKNRLDVQTELSQFYKNMQWVASTMPMGSYNDMEFVVSKKLIPNIDDLVIQFRSINENNETVPMAYPKGAEVTGDIKMDNQLIDGYLPDIKEFGFLK